ncbi:DUF4097 family beta strand repeat-containing protein [Gehongia tenuis]|uniref:DUF4097 family beta strand repeat protein n=1 Tax=Gehongia tenuis TaxID=2763655 RepID=A0A926HL54_9FIRM|nr:DUF4097 domain-containing protein [Gehongia tenuis]MBC8531692.1 DUF4097 family beta strand repeat protein [Gehongia tenuis]
MNPQKKKVGYFTLGIALLLTGVLILCRLIMDFDVIPYLPYAFPIVFIALGLEFLLTRIFAERMNPPRQVGASAIAIVLLVFYLLCVGGTYFVGYVAGENGWNIHRIVRSWDDRVNGHYVVQPPLVLKADAQKPLVVESSYGDIHVRESQDGEIIATPSIPVGREADMPEMILEEQADRYYLKVTPRDDGSIPPVDLDIVLPALPSVEIRSSYGDIDILDIGGNVAVDSAFGDVSIDVCQGTVSVRLANGDIEISEIKKDVTAENSFGDMELAGIGGSVKLTNQNGDITLAGIAGDIDASCSFGDIDYEHAARDLENATLSAKARFGSISADSLTDKVNRQTTSDSLDMTLGDGGKKVTLTTQNGSITID